MNQNDPATPSDAQPEPQPNETAQAEPQSDAPAEPAAGASKQPQTEQYSLTAFLKRALVFAVVLVVAAHLFLWSMIYFMQDSVMFPIGELPQLDPRRELNPDYSLWVELDDGSRVDALLLPGAGVSRESPGPLLVYFHGNAELIDHQPAMMANYVNLGINVLVPEYRGYGFSGGEPSQENIRADALEFLELAKNLPFVDGRRVAYHGRSLGGAVAADLAAHAEPDALILESTFSSAADMVPELRAPNFLFRNPYRSADTLRTLQVPTLVMHGELDNTIPLRHAERLGAAGPHVSTITFPEADHNNFPGNNGAILKYWQSIAAFLLEEGVLHRIEARKVGAHPLELDGARQRQRTTSPDAGAPTDPAAPATQPADATLPPASLGTDVDAPAKTDSGQTGDMTDPSAADPEAAIAPATASQDTSASGSAETTTDEATDDTVDPDVRLPGGDDDMHAEGINEDKDVTPTDSAAESSAPADAAIAE